MPEAPTGGVGKLSRYYSHRPLNCGFLLLGDNVSTNDITGDRMATKPSKQYADNYDQVFRKSFASIQAAADAGYLLINYHIGQPDKLLVKHNGNDIYVPVEYGTEITINGTSLIAVPISKLTDCEDHRSLDSEEASCQKKPKQKNAE